MAHHTVRSGYQDLTDRLNRFPQGAPPSESLYRILGLLFSEREARLVSLLPIRPFTASRAARTWRMSPAQAQEILEGLASRALLLDLEIRGRQLYLLPPPMAGFFEFSMMRLRGDVDQQALAELFHQYLNVEEDFVKALFAEGETQLGRILVHEGTLSGPSALHVMDYERASEVIRTARPMGVGLCYCRHKMAHLGRACDNPQAICMTFNTAAASLIKHGYARQVDPLEGLDLLQEARGLHLVQFGENVQRGVSFICNCCGCCCEAMIAARRFGLMHPVHTTNFLPATNAGNCNGCGKCVTACPVEAMSLVSAHDPQAPKRQRASLDPRVCLGCGVCAGVCARDGIRMESRPVRVITPLDSVRRTVLMAVERGKLQNLIFDHHALRSHRAMAAVLGVILKLPPVRRTLASRQLRSRYLDTLIGRSRA